MTPLKKYIWLVDTVMRAGETGLTLEQIADRWDHDDAMCEEGAFARRTFHRHRNEIHDLFGIEIECYNTGGSGHRYRIADATGRDFFRRWLLDSIAVSRIVTDSHDVAQFIAIESSDTSALPIMLQALKDRRMVTFDYSPYWADESVHYFNFQPHALKMFQRRWYLIGRFGRHVGHKIYALDRISSADVQTESYERDPCFDLDSLFDGAYGIMLQNDEVDIADVWLKVAPYQSNYLRSLPLHSSQVEVCRGDDYSVFAFRVRPTLDLRQKLLSLGSDVEVIKPESLRQEIKDEIEEMMKKYAEE